MRYEFPGKGKVAILKTRPETVLDDIGEVMRLAGYGQSLPKSGTTILNMDVSCRSWIPACSTSPWQLEGVVRRLQNDGYERLIAAHNTSAGIDAQAAEKNNKLKYVVDKYGVEDVHLGEPGIEWGVYEPKEEMLVLHDIFPEGITIPKMFIGPERHPATDSQTRGIHHNQRSNDECLKRIA